MLKTKRTDKRFKKKKNTLVEMGRTLEILKGETQQNQRHNGSLNSMARGLS